MKKKKYYRVLELTSDLQFAATIGAMTGIDTFETELESLQYIDDFKGGFYQLTILPVWE